MSPTEPHDGALRLRRGRGLAPWSAAFELIQEITATAERIAAARTWTGELAQRADATWRLLYALERSRYCLAIADVARALGVRRQTAHELVHATAARGLVELLPNPDDRRILQVFLTPLGRGRARPRTDPRKRLAPGIARGSRGSADDRGHACAARDPAAPRARGARAAAAVAGRVLPLESGAARTIMGDSPCGKH